MQGPLLSVFLCFALLLAQCVDAELVEQVCATVGEGALANLTCPTGYFIRGIDVAFYGTPTGSCGSFVASSSCNDDVHYYFRSCQGKASCSIPVSNGNFNEDPCPNVVKHVSVQASCVPPPTILSVNPATGNANGGGVLTITGINFGEYGISALNIQGPAFLDCITFTDTEITIDMPQQVSWPNIDISVVNGYVPSLPFPFTFYGVPHSIIDSTLCTLTLTEIPALQWPELPVNGMYVSITVALFSWSGFRYNPYCAGSNIVVCQAIFEGYPHYAESFTLATQSTSFNEVGISSSTPQALLSAPGVNIYFNYDTAFSSPFIQTFTYGDNNVVNVYIGVGDTVRSCPGGGGYSSGGTTDGGGYVSGGGGVFSRGNEE